MIDGGCGKTLTILYSCKIIIVFWWRYSCTCKMAVFIKDVVLTDKHPKKLLLDKHRDYIYEYAKKKDDFEYCITEYLRMSGMYWGVAALELMRQPDRFDRQEIIEFIKNCQHDCGGFGASIGHDPHILYTLSAIQILSMCDAVDAINVNKTVKYVKGLQQEDGSFFGDKWGEVDTRFTFCSIACLSLLGHMEEVDLDKAVEFVLSCMNFDGGFGCRPGSETHAGQVYCCLGTLSLTGQLHHVKDDLLGWWLCERQLPSGGLNGRPEKLPDVCYSWWVLASLKILGKLHWVDKGKLVKFILAAQDEEIGGFSDRPGDIVDPFHTLFGIAGLSLLGEPKLEEVNPVFCMPQCVIKSLEIKVQLLNS